MKASLIILTGASTVSAMWFPNFCCGGFYRPGEPQATATATATTIATTTAVTNIPTPTSSELGLSGIYPASSIDRKPTTLITSIIPTKSSDAASIPINEDQTFEVDPDIDAGITIYPESIRLESVHNPGEEDQTFEIDLATDVNPVDPDSALKRIAEETNSMLEANNLRLESLIQGFKANDARIQALIEKTRKLNAPEGVADNSEAKDKTPDEEEFSFPILPPASGPDMANGDIASGQKLSRAL